MSRISGRARNIDATDEMPKCQFAGIPFPVESIHIAGGIRHHVHEFPHMPGGAPEKLGRSLYRVTLVGLFYNRFAAFDALYPEGLRSLVDIFEFQQTKELLIPTLGTIDAFAVKWDRDWIAKIRSGEKVTMEFLEDQGSQFTLEAIASVIDVDDHAAAMAAQLAAVQADLSAADAAKLGNLFDNLQNAVNSLAAIQDQADLYGNAFEAKLNQIGNMCETIDGLKSLGDPKHWLFVEELHLLWNATIVRLEDLNNNQAQLQTFVVPSLMDVVSLSSAIYKGDSSRVSDILSLNVIPDAMRIKAGTQVRFYP